MSRYRIKNVKCLLFSLKTIKKKLFNDISLVDDHEIKDKFHRIYGRKCLKVGKETLIKLVNKLKSFKNTVRIKARILNRRLYLQVMTKVRRSRATSFGEVFLMTKNHGWFT